MNFFPNWLFVLFIIFHHNIFSAVPADFASSWSDRKGSDYYLDSKLDGGAIKPVSNQVSFSHSRGFYAKTFYLVLTSPAPNGKIYFTTNNEAPNSISGKLYSAPLEINATTVVRAMAHEMGKAPSTSTTHTYIFIGDIVSQSNQAPPDSDVFWDTEMDPDVVNDPRYKGKMEASLKAIPTVSVSMNDGDLFGIGGIHRGANLEKDIEFGGSAELIYPKGDFPGFQINCAVKLQGGASRWKMGKKDSKQSFSLKFKPPHGPSRLEYPAMESTPINKDWQVDEFNRLILRSSFNADFANSYSRTQRANTVLIRDQWGRGTQTALSGVGAQGTFVHLYLNGLYWGLYNLVERPDHHFSAIHRDGDDEEWFAWKNKDGGVNGSDARFTALRGAIVKSTNLDSIKQYINTTVYWDWVMVGFYAAVADLQWYVGNRISPPGPLLYYVWDFEDSWAIGPRSGPGARIQFHGYAQLPEERIFFQNMLAQPDLKLEFADRVYENCFHGGALSDSASQKRWMELANFVEEAIIAEYARWGDTREADNPLTRDDHWYKARDRVRDMMKGNCARFVSLLKKEEYYPKLDPPKLLPHGGFITSNTPIELQNPNGSGALIYTVDGRDPRERGGAQRSGALLFGSKFKISKSSVLKARVKNGNSWSPLAKVNFYLPTDYSVLHVTEIMYNPVNGKEFEFIELKNSGTEALSLAGFKIQGSVYYLFPSETTIPAGGFLVFASDSLTLKSNQPKLSIAGNFVRNLPNKGGIIELIAPDGSRVQRVNYDDKAPWPTAADGSGNSLVLKVEKGQKDLSSGNLWSASAHTGGSPGANDPNSLNLKFGHVTTANILDQNTPNPVHFQTNISFYLPVHLLAQSSDKKVSLTIYDLKGNAIQSKIWRGALPGHYNFHWNGLSSKGHKVAAGLYIYRLSLNNSLNFQRCLMVLP